MYDILLKSYQIKNNIHMPTEKLNKLQTQKLKDLVKHAYNTPFYKNKYKQANITPEQITSTSDITKLPFTTKQELQNTAYQDIVSPKYDKSKIGIRTTSGSTGVPHTIYIDKETSKRDSAAWNRAFFKNGLRYFDRMAIVRPVSKFVYQNRLLYRLGILRRKYIPITEHPKTQYAELKKYDPDVLQTYPSILYVLARNYFEPGEISPRMIFTSVETSDDEIRKLTSSVFGSEVFDYYSSEEFGLIAWECGEHSGYHVNSDSLIVEVVGDDGEPVGAGELGEVVVTSLNNFVQPLIRFRIGDMAVAGEVGGVCGCGVSFPKIERVEGRYDDFMMTYDGQLMSPRTCAESIQDPLLTSEGVINFRTIQVEHDLINVKMVVNDSFVYDEVKIEEQKRKAKKVFGDEMRIEYEIVDSLERDKSGKIRKFTSNILPREKMISEMTHIDKEIN